MRKTSVNVPFSPQATGTEKTNDLEFLSIAHWKRKKPFLHSSWAGCFRSSVGISIIWQHLLLFLSWDASNVSWPVVNMLQKWKSITNVPDISQVPLGIYTTQVLAAAGRHAWSLHESASSPPIECLSALQQCIQWFIMLLLLLMCDVCSFIMCSTLLQKWGNSRRHAKCLKTNSSYVHWEQ